MVFFKIKYHLNGHFKKRERSIVIYVQISSAQFSKLTIGNIKFAADGGNWDFIKIGYCLDLKTVWLYQFSCNFLNSCQITTKTKDSSGGDFIILLLDIPISKSLFSNYWYSPFFLEQTSKEGEKNVKHYLYPRQYLDRPWSETNISEIHERIYRSAAKKPDKDQSERRFQQHRSLHIYMRSAPRQAQSVLATLQVVIANLQEI